MPDLFLVTDLVGNPWRNGTNLEMVHHYPCPTTEMEARLFLTKCANPTGDMLLVLRFYLNEIALSLPLKPNNCLQNSNLKFILSSTKLLRNFQTSQRSNEPTSIPMNNDTMSERGRVPALLHPRTPLSPGLCLWARPGLPSSA